MKVELAKNRTWDTEEKGNLLISGLSASGKTTIMNLALVQIATKPNVEVVEIDSISPMMIANPPSVILGVLKPSSKEKYIFIDNFPYFASKNEKIKNRLKKIVNENGSNGVHLVILTENRNMFSEIADGMENLELA
jgi:predicted AAA+ superfamily ATPase